MSLCRIAILSLMCLASSHLHAAGGSTSGPAPASRVQAADLLAKLSGTWDATMQMAAQDGAPPVVLNGTEVNTPGGRGSWLVSDFRSQLEGHPFQGHAVLSFDPATRRFRRVWADSTSPVFWVSEGTWDPSTATLTMWIESTDTQGHVVRWREETILRDENTRSFTMYVPGPESTEAAGVTIVYHRRDAAAPRTTIGPVLAPPSAEHGLLRRYAGRWSAKVDDQRDASARAGSFKATESDAICCGGLFLVVDTEGDSRPAPFLGHGVIGYDPQRKKYVRAWVETGGEPLRVSEGVYDTAADALTLLVPLPDGHGGLTSGREVEEWKGKDQRTSTLFTRGPDGSDKAAVVTRYRRVK